MSNQVPYTTIAVVGAGVVGGYFAYRLYEERTKIKLPEQWKQVGTLKDMFVYPIKSCGSIKLNKAEVSVLGLKDGWLRDRILMVVDDKDNFITARSYPELLTVHPAVQGSILTLKQQDMEPLSVNLAEVIALQKVKTAKVWSVPVPVYDCGWEASEWFSRLIDRSAINYRLAYYASQHSRLMRSSTNSVYKFTKNDTGALPDEVPFNLINEASVEELNSRLGDNDQVTVRNFRPNFVLIGANAYDEDSWKFVKVGDHIFEVIKACTRCVLTTIDPETGMRNSKTEPLETLKSYRQLEEEEMRRSAGNSPRMGLQMALRSSPGGQVSLNDPIYVA